MPHRLAERVSGGARRLSQQRKPTWRARAARIPQVLLAMLLQVVGSTLVGFAMGQLVSATVLAQPAPAVPRYVVERLGCDACPAGVRFRAATVEAHQGSTLFSIDGTWPASVEALPADLRLVANDVELVFHPVKDGLEIAKAVKGAVPLPQNAVAVALREGSFLLNVADPSLASPVRFEFGLWKEGAYLGRLPDAGLLEWSGRGAPRLVGVAPAPTTKVIDLASAGTTVASAAPAAAPPASAVPASAPPVDVTALAGACAQLTTGDVAAYLRVERVGSGTDPDPRTQAPTRWVGLATAEDLPGADARPAFTQIAVVQRAGRAPGTGARAIDRVGDVQLWAYWDGKALHKALRVYESGSWRISTDAAADTLTLVLQTRGVAWFWGGLGAGDRFGFVSASAAGCRAVALDGGAPLETIR
jgi:hypothetical protein